jgi:hypothetical protein
MALEGNVKDFGLSEILQLIALQKKTGMLSVSGEESAVIFFTEGRVLSTRDRRSRARDPLKSYLLKYGFIGKEQMSKIQQIQMESNLDLTEILLSEKYFTEEELTTILYEQIQESIQEILSWPKSFYKFITGRQILRNIRFLKPIKVEGLLMESMRRIDEFPELQRIFPSEEMVLKRQEPECEAAQNLEGREKALFETLTQEKTLAELISQARMPRFCTYESLKNLLEQGLLEITKEPKFTVVEIQEVVEKETKGSRWLLPSFAVIVLLFACYAVGEYLVPRALPPGWSPNRRTEIPDQRGGTTFLAGSLSEFRLHYLEAAIEEGLEEYRATEGSYPFTLEVLAVKRIIRGSLLDETHQNGLIYKLIGDGSSYRLLRSAGQRG